MIEYRDLQVSFRSSSVFRQEMARKDRYYLLGVDPKGFDKI